MARTRPVSATRAPWGWAVIGLLAGLILAVVVFAPARWLTARVTAATEGQLLLQDARGTVWNGSARLLLTGGQASSDAVALPTRLEWRLRPGWGGFVVAMQSACCTPTPIVATSRMGWHGATVLVGDSRSQWPAALLAGLGTPWNTLQFEGDLALSTQSLSLESAAGRLVVAGRVELLAQRMSSRLSTLRPMGSYRIVVSGGPMPALQLSTLEGDLQLAGRGQWVGSRLRFTGEASATPEREAALANLLNIIGRRNGARSIITIG